jgi:LPXTG-motif cell wall-anchored protein
MNVETGAAMADDSNNPRARSVERGTGTRDIRSIAIGLAVVALLAVGGSGRAPASQASPPPADRVSHGAAGTARNGVGGSIAASPTIASWPGTGNGGNGGPFAFIGAQYGSLWDIPPGANNSLGVGYCVMEDISGEGVVSLRPDPAAWDAGEMARAAALMSSFGGDHVLPYGIDASGPYDVASGEWQQPTLFGGGEYTRRRHVAVNFGVKMFVEDVSPSGVAAGRKLARDTAVVDGSGENFPALRNGYTMAQRLAAIAEIQHAVGGVRLELRWDTADGIGPVAPGTYPLEVRSTDAAGKPVGFVPVVQISDVGHGHSRSLGAVAVVDTSTSTADDTARLTAAVAAGWPTMDMASRFANDATYMLAASPRSAGVTDAAGRVRFDVTIDRQAWELGFVVQAPTSDVSLYAGTGIQGQITWSGPPQTATVHEVAAPPVRGEVAVRKVVQPTDIGGGRDLSGFEFAISDLSAPADGSTSSVDGAGHAVLRTDASGRTPSIELPLGRYRVDEVAAPPWAAGLVDGGPIEFDLDSDGSDTVIEVVYTNTEPTASITTAARDQADGDQMIDLTQGDATIVDSVAYQGLVPGTEYVAIGELMRRPDGPMEAESDDDGTSAADAELTPTGIVGTTAFVAAAASGSVDVSFVVPANSPLVGGVVVAYQRIEVRSSGRTVATHHDPTSIEQTMWIPFVSTALMADDDADTDGTDDTDGTTAAAIQPGEPLMDLVAAYGLRPDRRYRADMTLHERLGDGSCVATDHIASAEFHVTDDPGPTTLVVRGFSAPHPGEFVAFQVLSVLDDDGERIVARHADCDSVSQRVQVIGHPVASTSTTTTTTTTIAPTPTQPTTTVGPVTPTTPPPGAPVPPRPTGHLPRTGTDSSTTVAVAGLALLLIGVGITSAVRRPRRPAGHRGSER